MAFNTPVINRRASYLAQTNAAYRSPQVRHSNLLAHRDSSIFSQAEIASNNNDVFPDAAPGDTVEVPGGWHGVVMYVGGVEGRSGNFLGVDLIELDADKGRNDGSYKGIKYFDAKFPSSGMFVPQGRCRVIETTAHGRNGSTREAGKLGIRPSSRMRSASGQSIAQSPVPSRVVSTTNSDDGAALHQRLLNDNARLTQELDEMQFKYAEISKQKTIQATEMDELMASVADLEAFIANQASQAHPEVMQLRQVCAERELKINQLRKEAEERRAEFKLVTEHQQATIDELKSLHEMQLAEYVEKHADLEERLMSSGSVLPSNIDADNMEKQITEMTEMFDILTEEQARARLDIDIANDRIQELEKENERLLDEVTESRLAKTRVDIKGVSSPVAASKRTSGIEHLPDAHPQKRQTVDFLEGEVERLKKENDDIRAATNAMDLSDAESQRITLLQRQLEEEKQARKTLEDQHAQMEETLERTICQMNQTVPDPRSPLTPKEQSVNADPALDGALKCEYCGELGHDIIDCTNVFGAPTQVENPDDEQF